MTLLHHVTVTDNQLPEYTLSIQERKGTVRCSVTPPRLPRPNGTYGMHRKPKAYSLFRYLTQPF